MATLTINFEIRPPAIRLKGLGVRNCPHNIFSSDMGSGWLCIDTHRTGVVIDGKHVSAVNERTAKIRKEYLIQELLEVYEIVPFDKIKVIGYYELSGEEILNQIHNHLRVK